MSYEENKPKLSLHLLVPYKEKDEAKSLGAFWNHDKKEWYLPKGVETKPFEKWISRSLYPYLYIDLVPKSAWYSNLRTAFKKETWDIIRKRIYFRANYRCEKCGGKGTKHPVEAHERWYFDEKTGIQTLIGIQALCPSCHLSTHMSFAKATDRFDEAMDHMMKVNRWSAEKIYKHWHLSLSEWENRSQMPWTVDLSWLSLAFGEEILFGIKKDSSPSFSLKKNSPVAHESTEANDFIQLNIFSEELSSKNSESSSDDVDTNASLLFSAGEDKRSDSIMYELRRARTMIDPIHGKESDKDIIHRIDAAVVLLNELKKDLLENSVPTQ